MVTSLLKKAQMEWFSILSRKSQDYVPAFSLWVGSSFVFCGLFSSFLVFSMFLGELSVYQPVDLISHFSTLRRLIEEFSRDKCFGVPLGKNTPKNILQYLQFCNHLLLMLLSRLVSWPREVVICARHFEARVRIFVPKPQQDRQNRMKMDRVTVFKVLVISWKGIFFCFQPTEIFLHFIILLS